ncbi:MAG TPA: hypothetical protein VFU21_31920 [Kofleriaceae bacterium]|nr:hypothetical protein [Kofleriaceae bacterium]
MEACATPALGAIAGHSYEQINGSGSFVRIRADLEWAVAATEGCVDTYVPSGQVTATYANPEGDTTVPVGAIETTDGELVVDRSRSPATYTMRGSTRGERWAAQHGTFDGMLLAGGGLSSYRWVAWELTAEGAAFPDPDGCVGAAVDTVRTVSWNLIRGSATWTRVETTGCVDRYVPEGTATHPEPPVPYWCQSATYSETSGRITPADYASLEIDRTSNPPRVHMRGATHWETDRTCTLPDGSTETERVLIGGDWALAEMAFDGARWSGALDAREEGMPRAAWSFTLP